MVFSSLTFLFFFLPAVLFLNYIAPGKAKNYILLAFSLLFYGWGGPSYLLLMLVSIAINYVFGLLIGSRKKPADKLFLAGGITANLLLLGYFKYANFLADNANKFLSAFGVQIEIAEILLPIGISFYTFQAISYLIDLYRGEFPIQKNPFYLALYISFFPQLIAGPIVQYSQIHREIDERTVTKADYSYGIKRFVYGLSKKILLANELAWTVDRIFAQPVENLSTGLAWLGVICYSFQIYYDFSGYSDMAIGLGRIFGFDFLENFNYPYLSKSVSEFWRRWHISLSSWFRSYLYIPLGGNRKGKVRTYINLFIVFLATGIWHGASWQFLIWGIYYGILLIAERLFLGEILKKSNTLARIYTLSAVVVGWTIFRGNGMSGAVRWLYMMFIPTAGNGTTPVSLYLDGRLMAVLAFSVLLCGILQSLPKVKDMLYSKEENSLTQTGLLAVLFGICVLQLVSGTYNPFIYFRF